MNSGVSMRRATGSLVTLLSSMRLRLTLWYLAILALVFLVFSGVLITEVRQNENAAQHTDLASVAQQLASAYDPANGMITATTLPLSPKPTSMPKAHLDQTESYLLPAQGVALLVSPAGNVIQAIGPLTANGIARLQTLILTGASAQFKSVSLAQAPSAYEAVALPIMTINGSAKTLDYIAYRTDVMSQGRLVGILVVATPNRLNQTAQSVIPALLVAGPVTLLVAAIGGYWLASRALRPVRLITRAAQEISETDLSRRLSLKSRDELGELAATFDHMLGRLEAAFQRQRQFTADASHELRTPLTIVNLEVTNALAAPRDEREYVRALTAIQAENASMSRLVNDLLTLARADANRAPLRLGPLDLSDVALEAVERLSSLAQRHGVKLIVGDLPEAPVQGDRDILAQALTNLVENGVKYTSGRGSQVTVTTRCVARDGRAWAVAQVKDDGPGIAAEHLPFLFERFYRVDVARVNEVNEMESDRALTGGSGLGLAIAQWAAQAHSGELRVESVVGAGAVFEVWLPLSGGAARASVAYCG